STSWWTFDGDAAGCPLAPDARDVGMLGGPGSEARGGAPGTDRAHAAEGGFLERGQPQGRAAEGQKGLRRRARRAAGQGERAPAGAAAARRRGGAGTRGELAERGDARARSGGARATRGRGRQARRRARGLREARWRAVKRLALAASLALAAACTNEKA